jgi:hypothetical protein
MEERRLKTMKKRFYFATQIGCVVYDDLDVTIALQVIVELKHHGFYYCYSMEGGER